MFAYPHIRVLFAAAAAAVATALLLIPGITQPAQANSEACHRYGDKRPKALGGKQATDAVICLINKKRRENGRGGLDRDGRLVASSRKHSNQMASKGCFSHECPGERSLQGRLEAVKYIVDGLSRWAYGENIGHGKWGRGTPREAVSGWMRSSGHRANILSGTFKDIGVGFANNGSRGYYTADFGLREK
jgi:uncharacterized protein YkwD